jgi:hypothetical protein
MGECPLTTPFLWLIITGQCRPVVIRMLSDSLR